MPGGVKSSEITNRSRQTRSYPAYAQGKVAESFKDQNHLDAIVSEAQEIVSDALGSGNE